MDYGTNIRVGEQTFLNVNTMVVDTCLITIGARTMFGPNCQLYSGTHPVDPALRNGLNGPESGKEIHIGEDCWLGGNAIVLPGVTIGKGATIGAGSVVTKVKLLRLWSSILSADQRSVQDVPAFHVAAGNPARVLRKIETAMDKDQDTTAIPASREGAEGAETIIAKET